MNHSVVNFEQGGILTFEASQFSSVVEACEAVEKALNEKLQMSFMNGRTFDDYQDLEIDVSPMNENEHFVTVLMSFEANLRFPTEEGENPEKIVSDQIHWTIDGLESDFSVQHSEITEV